MSNKANTRFEFEQELLECWKVTEDIKLWSKRDAKPEDWQALSTYYDHKFNQLWDTFEELIKTRQL